VDIVLFPGMVRVVEGVIVKPLPAVLLSIQNVYPRLTLFSVKVLGLPVPPVEEFQVTWTSRTVIVSCGLMIVILIVLLLPPAPGTEIELALILPHPGTAVGVVVGVKVSVGVGVIVGVLEGVNVAVIVGVSVGVLVSSGVSVNTGPDASVAVGVSDGTVAVGVSDGTVAVGVLLGPDGTGVFVGPALDPSSTNPKMVRALDETNVFGPIGISLVKGLYWAVTSTSTRSWLLPEFTSTSVSSPLEASHTSNEVVPGPWSYSTLMSLSCKFKK